MIKEPTGTTQDTIEKKLPMPEYKAIEKINIKKSVLKSLVKFSENTTNNTVEGFLFGHEGEDEVIVDSAFTSVYNAANNDTEIHNTTEYLRLNRLDYIQVGYFINKEFTEILKKRNLKRYIDFQIKFPNAVFIFFDYGLYINGNYSFQCFRLTKKLMEVLDKMEIEEELQDINKKSIPSEELIKNLNFTLIEDGFSVLSTVVSTGDNYEEKSEKNIAVEMNKKNCAANNKTNLMMRVNELNKKSESFIEEQKKYLNYYKVKRQFGKNKEAEFAELLTKKGSELASLDKMDMSLLSKNITNMNARVKTVIDSMNVKNVFNLDI